VVDDDNVRGISRNGGIADTAANQDCRQVITFASQAEPPHAAHTGALTLCPHRPPCSGCPRFGERGIAPAAHGALESLARAHGLPEIAVISGATAGFRHRARLAIRGRLGSPKVGLFELDTHRVVHIPNCSVQHPLINRVAAIVRRALVDARVTCYSDKAHLGIARYLQVVVERSSQTAQVVIVANCATPEPLAACLGLIRERLGSDLHSLWFNANLERSNVILGPDFINWCGPESVVEHFGGAAAHYPPGAFGQSNLDIAQRIVGHVRDEIPQGASVAEFYAGVGAIGLSILGSVREIRMNEVSPQALKGLELGLAQLDPADRAKISVVPGAAGAACSAALGAQVVIADPPRKGLDRELTEHLSEHPPERFLYISCGLDSFVGDAARLVSSGKLRLAALSAFNFLPFTEHVETVARFERA
jgi:tRNA/tmRNA/rRNA uracil-C5-methylase (TrmA/RlmC/RlmD family)